MNRPVVVMKSSQLPGGVVDGCALVGDVSDDQGDHVEDVPGMTQAAGDSTPVSGANLGPTASSTSTAPSAIAGSQVHRNRFPTALCRRTVEGAGVDADDVGQRRLVDADQPVEGPGAGTGAEPDGLVEVA